MDEYVPTLDHTFSALAHPTRRDMLKLLVREPVRVTDLAAQFDCSLNVASKHILSLERAGLVKREQKGREHWLRLDAAPLSEAFDFVQRYHHLWEQQLDRLGSYLNTMAEQTEGSSSKAKSKISLA
ncbi:transcriptional regulator, ArsR family [Prosthecobacter debontii]|uniref:Transcriptional regulator, ArsR family n=1 Tax=Prosthecobacter debontii TaxID=48467 RepID=A0A1T4Z183_9BACT|nr:metalloregulator ArsR/SmtB family transcription factor [Prosthecobacter debontii]SKB07797.1 transcriptional regulator, ArsR family [Prosthecobacter debontii]